MPHFFIPAIVKESSACRSLAWAFTIIAAPILKMKRNGDNIPFIDRLF